MNKPPRAHSTAQSTGHPWRSRLRYVLLNTALSGFSWLSLASAHRLGAWLGRIATTQQGKLWRISLDNIQRCLPELSAEAQDQLARHSLIEAGKTLVEMGAVWRAPWGKIAHWAVTVEGLDALHAARTAGRGVILLSPHIGAWEFGGLYTAQQLPTTTLYRPPREPAFEALITQARSRTGTTLVPANRQGVKALLLALRRNELAVILPDQEPAVGEGAFAPFFGHPAYTLTLVHSLMQRTGAPAFFGFAERLPNGQGFHLRYLPAPEGLDAADPATALAALNAGVEQIVRLCPAQYQWSYRRFRRQPTTDAPD